MTVRTLRQQLKRTIDRLPEDRLRSAADFVAYLQDTANPVAVTMATRIKKAEREIAEGRFVSVKALRRSR